MMLPRAHRLQQRLLTWYGATGRDLAWRRTRDPYEVLVAELMLQQTQAARVEVAWAAFLRRFPDVRALAAASTADVVQAWRGLGYNRRAINLQRAASAIVTDHGGVVPADVATLEGLPGVGPYTARAVAVFAHGQPVAPVDVNVARVLARAVTGAPLGRRDGQAVADVLVPHDGDVAVWTHALMDLGARRCRARDPLCSTCPVAADCAWHLAGAGRADPAATGAVRSRPQPRFEGSDRYHRGRLVDALRERAIGPGELAEAADLSDPTRLERIIAGLVSDGLAQWEGEALALPGRECEGGTHVAGIGR